MRDSNVEYAMKFFFLLCLSFYTVVSPAAPIEGDSFASDRQRFSEAYAALKQGKRKRAKQLVSGLESYPLFIYFRYFELNRKLPQAPKTEIREFLAAYDESLLAKRLRRDWLKFLGRTHQWQEFLVDYRPQSDVKLRCTHLAARIATGAKEGVASDARVLWLSGKSQPAECDDPFSFLSASELMNDQLRWQRIRLALGNNKPSLANYLSRQLQDSELKRAAEHWIAAHTAPIDTLKKAYFKKDNARSREIVVHAIDRIARNDVHQAIAVWKREAARFDFDDNEAGRVKRIIGVAAARQDSSRRLELLDQIPQSFVDNTVEKYRIREAITAHAWELLARWTEHPPVGSTALLRWRYWRARALEAVNRTADARLIFAELARERDYYGFLSADRQNVAYQANDRPIAPSASEIANITSRPGLIRARELVRLAMTFEARREWAHEIGNLDIRQLEIAAHVVTGWGWHDRAILALGKAKSYDDLTIRFPLLFDKLIDKYAEKRQLAAADIFSIIRTESAFMTDARSPVGALGLMQLMPNTGRETARRIGTTLGSARELLKPEKNIMVGSAYLKRMLKRFNGSFILAAAAYNAGPHRVKTWLPKSGCTPADIWVDTIPFTETRKYVRRAVFNAMVYHWRLEKEIPPLATRLKDVTREGIIEKC
ncbi:MAG: soluble lytic murein transglycosylase [Gammaproteobacteria bacterium]|jgi:soluble lytic murein transglycosylase